MSAIAEAFDALRKQRSESEYLRGFAAGWYSAQLEQAQREKEERERG